MGYGFVRYKRKRDADHALKTLQMTVLDGKSLELKRSERILTYVCRYFNLVDIRKQRISRCNCVKLSRSDVKTARKKSKITEQTGTKILVRNVPFQATVAEITELFKYAYRSR